MSFLDDLLKKTAATATKVSNFGPTKGAFGGGHGKSKIAKACSKHRADHSNPGGIISEYFRQKRAKI